MKLFGKNLEHDVAIVAEIGVNHEGGMDAALKLIKLAAESGADAVKFQSYTPSRFVSSDDTERLERVTRFGLNESEHKRLAETAADHGISFFSSAITEDWVPLLAELGEVIKVASGDLTFEPVIRAVAATGLPIILSTGLGTTEEVDQAVEWILAEIGDAKLDSRLILMHCVSAYPTPIEEVNLLSVPFLADRYDVTVGYSNHVIGMEACIAAVALGARVLEVHFTDQKSGRSFRDHSLSFEPENLSNLVEVAPQIARARGAYTKDRQPCELPNLDAVRKGVVAARDLPSGTVLALADLMFARPATGIPAGEVDDLVGMALIQPLTQGNSLKRDMLKSR